MMGRQPRRASGLKALQAIKATSRNKVTKGRSENAENDRLKASVPGRGRNALGDVTNQTIQIPQCTIKMKPKPAPVESSLPRLAADRVPEHLELAKKLETDVTINGKTENLKDGVKWTDIDEKEKNDPLFCTEYAKDIYEYMRERELHFMVHAYMSSQPDISASMRTILVDWLIEVQENFELFHETLYLAVQITDRYLAHRDVRREYLQLVGATSMLIAAKFEELSPPLVDDFLYLCDDAYNHEDLLKMEQDILKALDYDINIPVAYRFLRRLARAADASMETHTLARYIAESTLQEYAFVTERPSYVAACSMYLALRMKRLGPWTPTLQHYSGYHVAEMMPLVKRLNQLLRTPLDQTATVRSKYSHEVFFKVATVPPLEDVEADARSNH